MNEFRYERPTTRAAALAALAAPGSVAIGGGTDLLVTVEEGLVRPELVVDVRALPDAQQITIREDGSAHLGAAVRRVDGTVRVAFGGAALGPWRLTLSVEEDIASGGLDDDSLDALAERAMYDTAPPDGTAYKVTLAKALLRRAMRALG